MRGRFSFRNLQLVLSKLNILTIQVLSIETKEDKKDDKEQHLLGEQNDRNAIMNLTSEKIQEVGLLNFNN